MTMFCLSSGVCSQCWCFNGGGGGGGGGEADTGAFDLVLNSPCHFQNFFTNQLKVQ